VISNFSGRQPLCRIQCIAAPVALLVALATVIIRSIARPRVSVSSTANNNRGDTLLRVGQAKGYTRSLHEYKGVNIVGKIRPVGDRVVVKPAAKEEVTKSGIVIPDTAKEKPQEGTVVAVGSGRLLENGERAALDVHEGDRVLFAKYGGTEFKLEGEEYLVLKENDILAIIG
jgi:chaperonin GroES